MENVKSTMKSTFQCSENTTLNLQVLITKPIKIQHFEMIYNSVFLLLNKKLISVARYQDGGVN